MTLELTKLYFASRLSCKVANEGAALDTLQMLPLSCVRDLEINDLPVAGRMPCAPTLDLCQRVGCYLIADP